LLVPAALGRGDVLDDVAGSYGCALLRLESGALGVQAARFCKPVILQPKHDVQYQYVVLVFEELSTITHRYILHV
jgi:hypothetical protein